MNRRSFLQSAAGAVTAVAVGSAAPVAAVDDSVFTIDVDMYRTSQEHRETVDQLMARAGVGPQDVRAAHRQHGTWTLELLERDRFGKRFIRAGEFARRTVIVP